MATDTAVAAPPPREERGAPDAPGPLSSTPDPQPPAETIGAAPPVRRRLLYAWAVTALVLLSYLGVAVVAWLRGKAWKERALLRCHRRNARRVARALVRLQGLFVKVGQLLSMLTNFLPAEFRQGLEALQDRVPARPFAEVAARLQAELGAPPGLLFAELDPRPLASASLAQVHAALLADGRRVAVKVQHLGIEKLAQEDLRTIAGILRLVSLFVRVRGLRRVHVDLKTLIEEELDFAREARNVETIAAAFAGEPTVGFPAVVAERSTARVLTTTFVDGIKVSHREALLAAGFDLEQVATTILRAYCRMIFEHGVYHADPHPGNLFVRGDGSIAFVDFGAVGRLSPAMREGIPELLEAVLARDPARILGAMRRMGFVAREGDERTAEKVVGYLHRRFLEQLTVESWSFQDIRVDARMKLETLGDLRRLDVSLRDLMDLFEVPRDWVVLERTLLLLVGLCAHLAPQMNPMTVVRPYVESLVLGRDQDWPSLVARTLKDWLLAAIALPGDLRRTLAKIERGELEVRVPAVREGFDRLYAAAHQLLWGVIASTAALIGYLAQTRGEADLARAGAGVAAGAAVLLLISLWRARRRPR
jgi:predicted unusual protein kinase regulating ubiquinone biosynthesis (AarF/ABC1/UbiB family)